MLARHLKKAATSGGVSDPILALDHPDLLASYDGNITGSTLNDESGNGRHATISGGPIVAGKIGDALSLNTGTNYITIPSSVYASNMHVVCWVQFPVDPSSGQQIIYSDYGFSTSNRAFELLAFSSPEESRCQASDDGGAADVAGDGLGVSTGTWYLYEGFVDNSVVGVARDNATPSTTAHTGGIHNSGVAKYFGARDTDASGAPDSNFANIIIDLRIRIFNRRLTDLERAAFWNGGTGA